MEKKSFKHLYWITFGMALLLSFMIFIPILAEQKWIMILYNDFHTQEIPVHILINRVIKNWNGGWIWSLDLGSEFVGSMGCYAIGSPFTWLSWLVSPEKMVYVFGWLMMLKYAAASVTAAMYMRRHQIEDIFCMIGGLLYAFSGYQATNTMFYWFHDAIVFFPLLLMGIDCILEDKGHKGLFALTVCFSAMVNYYLFTQEVVFLIIYGLCRVSIKEKETWKKIGNCLIEGITGCLLAGVILVPSFYCLLGNQRIGAKIPLRNWISLDKKYILELFRNFCFPAESMGNSSAVGESNFSSWAAYLPMVSVCGVIIYLIYYRKQRDWLWKLLVTIHIFAFIPVLNSVFGFMADSNYKRWYFTLILMTSMATAKTLQDKNIINKYRFVIFLTMLCMIAGSILIILWDHYKNVMIFRKEQFYSLTIIGILGVFTFGIISFCVHNSNLFKWLMLLFVSAFAVISTKNTLWDYTKVSFTDVDTYMSRIQEYAQIKEYVKEGYRIETENDNLIAMVHDINSTGSFDSTVSGSIFEFYQGIGEERAVFSPKGPEGTQQLLSAKYYLTKEETKDRLLMDISTGYYFHLYERNEEVPTIGFAVYGAISEEEFRKIDINLRPEVMKYVSLVSDVDKVSEKKIPIYNHETIMQLMEEKSYKYLEQKAYDISQNENRYEIKIDSSEEELIYFTIPYDIGFSVAVNGQETEILKSNGMMAVAVEPGTNHIVFTYHDKILYYGIGATVVGIVLWMILRKSKRKDKNGI